VTAKNGFVVEEQKLCFPAGVVKLIVEMELALSGVGKESFIENVFECAGLNYVITFLEYFN